jgi:predicted transport protein
MPLGLLIVGGTLETHAHLSGTMLELFEHSRKRVPNLDSSVREEVLKLYVAYKGTTNFVDVVPQKSRIRFSLNMDFDEVHDPKRLGKLGTRS